MSTILAPCTDKFKDEEVRVAYGYPKEYKCPKPIEQQIKAIAEIFSLDPALTLEYAKKLPVLPEGAEGWFAIPSVDALAQKHFPEVIDPAEKYCRALQLVHQKIAASRLFTNWRDGQIDTAHFKVSPRTQEMMQKIAETQKGDILIIAPQLGKRHGGRSVRRAREVFVANEYGLTSVAIGSPVGKSSISIARAMSFPLTAMVSSAALRTSSSTTRSSSTRTMSRTPTTTSALRRASSRSSRHSKSRMLGSFEFFSLEPSPFGVQKGFFTDSSVADPLFFLFKNSTIKMRLG